MLSKISKMQLLIMTCLIQIGTTTPELAQTKQFRTAAELKISKRLSTHLITVLSSPWPPNTGPAIYPGLELRDLGHCETAKSTSEKKLRRPSWCLHVFIPQFLGKKSEDHKPRFRFCDIELVITCNYTKHTFYWILLCTYELIMDLWTVVSYIIILNYYILSMRC